MRFFFSALLAIAGFSFLSAQETPTEPSVVEVEGKEIVQDHSLMRELKFALVAYPLNPEEAQYAQEIFPILEAWARMHPDLWFAKQAKENQVANFLAMPLWKEANLDGRSILTLQLKVQLADDYFTHIHGNEDYLDFELEPFIEQSLDTSLTLEERSAAKAKVDYFRKLNEAFKAHPVKDEDDFDFASIVSYGISERWEVLMREEGLPAQGPLLFQFPGTPFAFHAGPEWVETLPEDESKNRFHIPNTLLVVDFFQFTLEAPRDKWDLFFSRMPEQTIDANEGSKLVEFEGISPHGEGFHSYYDVVFADSDKHMVVHYWIFDGEVYQLTFLNTTFPWQPAKIVLKELLSGMKAPEPPKDLLESQPQAQLFLADDSPWIADTDDLSAANLILEHANSSASISITSLDLGEKDAIEDWYLETIVDQSTERIPDARALESKWVSFKGKPSAYTDLESSTRDKKGRQRIRVMLFLHNEWTFIIVITSDLEDWEKTLPAAQKVLEAIDFS